MNTRSRGWIVVINNYSDDDVNRFEELQTITGYMCYGLEEAPTTGTKHIQGYIYFPNAKTFQKVTKLIPKAHIEVAKGSSVQNRIYSGAEEYVKNGKVKPPNPTFKEFGTIPAQGKRTDLDEVKDEIAAGGGMQQIIEIAKNYQSLKMGEMLLKYKERKRDFKPKIVWYYGESGTGKTRTVYEACPDVYRKTNSTGKWWEGYDAHPHVLLDDIKDNSKEMYIFLLEFLDRYEMRVEGKGGSRQMLAEKIYITSIQHPKDLFDWSDCKELLRRIDVLKEIKNVIILPL